MQFDWGQVTGWTVACLSLAGLVLLLNSLAGDLYETFLDLVAKRDKIKARRRLLDIEIWERKQRALTIVAGPDGYRETRLADPNEPLLLVAGQAALGWEPVENVPHTIHVAIKKERGPQMPQQPQITISPPVAKQSIDLKDHMELIRPGQALLAMSGNEGMYTSIDSLVHPAIAGSTGGGKTNIIRLLLLNMILANVHCYLLDPHFAVYDPKSKEDWRPIVGRLAAAPILDPALIAGFVRSIANVTLPKRYSDRAAGKAPGAIICLFIDELPSIVAAAPEVTKDIAKILREGRKVGIFVACAAQDFLVSSIGGNGGVRDCFRTAYYTGGDATTARVLLDMSPGQRVDESGLGKGVAMLRSAATPTAERVLVPYVSNECLYEALGDPGEIVIGAAKPVALPRGPRKSPEDEVLLSLYKGGHTSCRSLATAATAQGYPMAKDKAAARMAALGLKEVKEARK